MWILGFKGLKSCLLGDKIRREEAIYLFYMKQDFLVKSFSLRSLTMIESCLNK